MLISSDHAELTKYCDMMLVLVLRYVELKIIELLLCGARLIRILNLRFGI